ncbi:terpene synthase family protein [Streptomyces mobaraensis]|uniref:terpene synthase family protein n=1 Tax=Streptomyces mobaraensis TaxID=35621 RepID=UPI00332B2DD5
MRRQQRTPLPWRHWGQWVEAYPTEASWRHARLWPSPTRFREFVRSTSAAPAFPLLSDHLSGLYLRASVLNSSFVTALRALVPDHTMAVDDVYSARREARAAPAGCAALRRMTRLLRHWFAGNLTWHTTAPRRYATGARRPA